MSRPCLVTVEDHRAFPTPNRATIRTDRPGDPHLVVGKHT